MSEVSDATALSLRAYTHAQPAVDQTDVTAKVQSRYHNRAVTPMGSYAQLFGQAPPGKDSTLKVQVRYWREGAVRYLEFPQDSPLDLTPR